MPLEHDPELPASHRSPGRPRREGTTAKVLAATRVLLARHGYAGVTIADIATQAGIGRQTLYRRWPSKADVVLDAMFESAAAADDVAYNGLEETLSLFLSRLFAHLRRDGEIIRNLIACSQADETFREQFSRRFARPREAAVEAIFQQALNTGELPAETDIAMLIAMIHGAFWYRLLLDEPLDDAFARRLARTAARR